MAMALFPDMAPVNAFLSENGLPPLRDSLIGAGGGGRGGVIGGLAFGGIGWGVWSASQSSQGEVEWVFGGGGFDLGVPLGGDQRSVLTVGSVFGGGASALSFTPYPQGGLPTPSGIVPAPATIEVGWAVGFVQPYVSMAAQLLPWMGFELRLGYILPVFGVPFGSASGLSASSLTPSGPTVSLGLVFGGIAPVGSPAHDAAGPDQITQISSGTFIVPQAGELVIDNTIGDILILSYSADSQTPSRRVEWQATRTASKKHIDALRADQTLDDRASRLETVGTGRIDYELRVPAGIDLAVRNGTGDVTLIGHSAMTILLETGIGIVLAQDARAETLIASAGIGSIGLHNTRAATLIADVGMGEIELLIPPGASARLSAQAGLGDIAIDRFPGMTGGVRGFLGKTAHITLGQGADSIELRVGLGSIGVGLYLPVPSVIIP